MQQADCAHSAAVMAESSGISHTASPPNRRDFVAAFVTVPAAAALGAASAGAAARRPWDQRLAEYRAATKAADAFNEAIYRPSWARLTRIAGKEPTLSFTHTARSGYVATFRMTSATVERYAANPVYGPLARRVGDTWSRWKRRQEVAERAVNWSAIVDRQDALDVLEYRAQNALIAEPAPDYEALAIKLRVALTRVAGELMDQDRNALLTDLERLVF